MTILKLLLFLTVAATISVISLVYAGVINIAADTPHAALTLRLIETLRERSIAVRARRIEVPVLDDQAKIAEGAEHYAAMCTGCHLAPERADTEMRQGMYPQPPNLTQRDEDPPEGMDGHAMAARQFWIIKHGIKASGMPAWGLTHSDESIWGLVAFLQKLPELSPDAYRQMTARAAELPHGDHHDEPVHDHSSEHRSTEAPSNPPNHDHVTKSSAPPNSPTNSPHGGSGE